MITPHRFAALPSTLILLLLTCLPTPALGDDSEDGPSTLTLTTAEHYVEELESETEWARGKPFKLGHSAREAMKRVKALVKEYPDHPKVKELFERVKICVKKSRGEYFEITEEMLAYRKLEQVLVEKLGEQGDLEWEKYETALKASKRFLPDPFPAPEPGLANSETKMFFRRVILKGFEFPAKEFTNSGRQYVQVGSPTKGLYYVDLSDRRWLGAYEALKRYRREAAGTLPKSWTIVGTVTGSEVLVPRSGEKSAAEVARFGWVVRLEAIYLPGLTFAFPDRSHPQGGSFAGEDRLEELKSPMLTYREVPKEVDPDELVRIYATAIKEKSYKLYLDCLDPNLQGSPLALQRLRFYWDVTQRGFAESYVHVDPFEVGSAVAIQGEKLDEEEDDAFFLDEEDKEEIREHADDLIEELHVTTRRFDERGKQVGTPRDVILRRYKGGRWYVYNGLVL